MTQKHNSAFAEVIESSLTGWLAQSWQWDYCPQFGSVVTIQEKNRSLFGIVYQTQTGSMDPVRYPFAYQKTTEELEQEQPQIFEFLKTTFHVLIIGYQERERMYYMLAPEPAKTHAFVYPIQLSQAKQLFSSDLYLHVLFGQQNTIPNIEELLLAIIKQQIKCDMMNEERLEHFIQQYSLLIGNDYRRTKLFLQRVSPLL